MTYRNAFLCGAALLSLPAAAAAQQPPAEPGAQPALAVDEDEFGEEEEAIVVQGARPRGSVIGDIPPQNVLDARDVRATGATSISDLLDALGPQIGSAQGRGGGRPITLLNGQRVSGFRELRDIPTEAIQRVEILPEEVALKYGYRADQKVVNIILRQRFRSTTVQAGARAATDGGYVGGNGDVTQFIVQRNGRTTLNAHAETNDALTEAERDILIEPGAGSATVEEQQAARTLLPSRRELRASATVNRDLGSGVAGTVNGEVEHSRGRSLLGLGDTLLLPLARETSSTSAHLGAVVNGNKSGWRWSVTGNGDVDRNVTDTDRDNAPGTRARQTIVSGDVSGTANGKLFTLPAGDASTTLSLGASSVHVDSSGLRETSLGRTQGDAAINVDLPISRRNRDFAALGNLTLNANAEVNQLSDFGTLTVIGAGANWSPLERLSFIASWSREEGAPTINQLGDPLLVTSGTRIFDFSTGTTALVTATTGGNPELRADRRQILKLGANWQPLEETDLRLRGEYVHQNIDRPISSLSVTPALELAFPDRFERDAAGNLTAVDLRPINFDRSRRDTLRVGLDFSKPLQSRRPSPAVLEQMRAQFGFGGRQGAGAGNQAARPQTPDQPARARGGGRGGGGGGRFFGGGNRGRLTFSLTDTITLVDKVVIAPGLPQIDYLNGDAAGQSGGTPQHRIEARAGYFNNGLGARLAANWRSGTSVDTLAGDELRFSPLSTVDLRLFANLGDIPELVVKEPWLRGSQVQLRVDNIFNSRPTVRNASGDVPLNYQPGLLDPLGRTLMVSFRKLFLPSPAWFRRQFQEMRQQGSR